MWVWIIAVAVVLALFYALDREIYFYEGTHLGPRVQAWLYDRWAKKYDTSKGESQKQDADMLARPVMEALRGIPAPFILDLATGTGRLPLSLLKESAFNGHILAVDVSQGMLEQAAQKLEPHQGRFTLLRLVEFPLPFPDHSFDMVSCMEALEVMPEMDTPLNELFRVLRPGGFFLTSHGTEASGRKSKVMSKAGFKSLLESKGFEQVEITPWWKWFDRTSARKPGQASPSGHHTLTGVLQCPTCKEITFENVENGLTCRKCGKGIPTSASGIVSSQSH
ncbi:MAG: methyltransferase domain-containing protein [Chloroflexi bacterium]|nr:methyltransferase domain-containing protein [Chloroflexota bacterium]